MADDNDAIVAIATTADTALKTAQSMGGFISRFVSVPLEQAAGIFADKLAYHRFENQIRLQQRAEQFIRDVGWRGPDRSVQLKFAVPLLSAATLEDDSYLQDWWARLLVNAASTQSEVTIQKSFIDVLSSLSPLDAQVLDILCRHESETPSSTGWTTRDLPTKVEIWDDEAPRGEAQDPSPEVAIALANLERLGCISGALLWNGRKSFRSVTVTFFGEQLLAACSLPE
ncbi:Abi-alpha family protein [Paraburkholderia phytofirmans]|jgi:hypothetical protein|uniref:Abi-alpha family protein n=1 Tax=Paraburkholderia phytofirmans TaxID=261302 RepID=UPI0038BB15BF